MGVAIDAVTEFEEVAEDPVADAPTAVGLSARAPVAAPGAAATR